MPYLSPTDIPTRDEADDLNDAIYNSDTDGLLKESLDLEAQPRTSSPNPVEDRTSLRAKLFSLLLWFALNLFITLSNKALLGKASFPLLLTTLHTLVTTLGCLVMMGAGKITLTRIGLTDNLIMVAFSILSTFNIAISNVSLAMISVSLHQIMRSTGPLFTMLIYLVFYGRSYSTQTYLSVIPLVAGVGLATIGDYYATILGFTVTLFGVMLSSIKAVATNQLMTGSLKFSALELLLRMSPLATIQTIIVAFLTGEVDSFRTAFAEGEFSAYFGLALLANGAIAFLLNLVSMYTNKLTGALTMTVAGNVKQALTILLGIILFRVQTGLVNAAGMAITLVGATWYSRIELQNMRAKVWG